MRLGEIIYCPCGLRPSVQRLLPECGRTSYSDIDLEEWIVATDVTTGIASQGKNNKEALKNLREALELYYEDVSSEEKTVHPTMLTTNLPT